MAWPSLGNTLGFPLFWVGLGTPSVPHWIVFALIQDLQQTQWIMAGDYGTLKEGMWHGSPGALGFQEEAEEPCGSFHDSMSLLLFPPSERPAELSSPQGRGEHVHKSVLTWYLRILFAKVVGVLLFLGL